jgi:glycosyltransferase involved in cell wall biosynthesis
MAEAMALGTPVIATGYSGNMDFMDSSTAELVPYRLVSVGEGKVPYPPEAHWADADVDAAARAIRAVHDHPDKREAMADRARSRVNRQLSPSACGQQMRARLAEIRSARCL